MSNVFSSASTDFLFYFSEGVDRKICKRGVSGYHLLIFAKVWHKINIFRNVKGVLTPETPNNVSSSDWGSIDEVDIHLRTLFSMLCFVN